MTLSDKLLADMKAAMKQKEAGKIRLSTIRMVRASQKEMEIEKKHELSDEEMLDIISREVKKRKDALADYEKADRPELVEQLHEEIKILQEYLPEQLGENEIRQIIKEVIQETGANNLNDLGPVMKNLMPRLKGRADGKTVNNLVREMLH